MLSKLEDITIDIDLTKYAIPPKGYCLDSLVQNKTNVATIAIMAADGEAIILGDVFLRNWYAKFNLADNTISFA
jgi:hypothetical protein